MSETEGQTQESVSVFKIIGRERELEQLIDCIKKGRHILLTGKMGCGKSAILREAYDYFERETKIKILYCADSTPLKSLLVNLAKSLHEKYQALRIVGLEDMVLENLEWRQLQTRFSRMNNKDQAASILSSLLAERFCIILDQLERVTPMGQAFIEALIDRACIVGATCDEKSSGQLARMWWRFKKLEVLNLSKEDSFCLIEQLILQEKVLCSDIEMFKRQVYKMSMGNPLAIKDIINAGSLERYVSQEQIRNLERHDAGKREIDLTPGLLVVGVFVVGARFVALGMNDIDLYILAGATGAGFMFLRFFLYRAMRKKKD